MADPIADRVIDSYSELFTTEFLHWFEPNISDGLKRKAVTLNFSSWVADAMESEANINIDLQVPAPDDLK